MAPRARTVSGGGGGGRGGPGLGERPREREDPEEGQVHPKDLSGVVDREDVGPVG